MSASCVRYHPVHIEHNRVEVPDAGSKPGPIGAHRTAQSTPCVSKPGACLITSRCSVRTRPQRPAFDLCPTVGTGTGSRSQGPHGSIVVLDLRRPRTDADLVR